VFREERLRLIPKTERKVESIKLDNISLYVRQSLTRHQDENLPRAVVLHDSFIHELRPFISEHFSRVRYIWDWDFNFYTEIIIEENPDIVIEEMAERFLLDKVLKNPEEVRNF
jgi:hypothetical protein